MPVRILTAQEDLRKYDRWLKSHPQGNLWQSLERRTYLESLGKDTRVYVLEEGPAILASALVHIDTTSFDFATWEIARGPIWDLRLETRERDGLLKTIIADAQRERALVLFLSPSSPQVSNLTSQVPSRRHIHCDATRIIDITKSDDAILAQMKPKGRYNIKVAEKEGVTVAPSTDVDAFYDLVTKTGVRDGFTHLQKAKYRAFLKHMPGAFLLLAYDNQKKPVAGLIGVVWNGIGVYYYGASDYAHRALMAPYALQWEAIRHCKAQGATKYDLLGIAPPDSPAGHPWAGISSFKEKFGGDVITYPPEQMVVLRPWAWRMLQMKRRLWK